MRIIVKADIYVSVLYQSAETTLNVPDDASIEDIKKHVLAAFEDMQESPEEYGGFTNREFFVQGGVDDVLDDDLDDNRYGEITEIYAKLGNPDLK